MSRRLAIAAIHNPPEQGSSALELQLYDQGELGKLLILSKKTVQNIYSRTPHLLPPAIRIPGARGPRWTPRAVLDWFERCSAHSSAPAPAPEKRKVGRPRIAAVAGKRGDA